MSTLFSAIKRGILVGNYKFIFGTIDFNMYTYQAYTYVLFMGRKGESLMARYWIGVASREHVMRGVAGGFAQVCHGKQSPLSRMRADDWIMYYSPTEQFGGNTACRRFTALGRIRADEPYQVTMTPDFTPWRVNVRFVAVTEVAIEPLLDKLSFIKDKRRWGFPFRRGLFEITQQDFDLISSSMGFHGNNH